jgi:hypothetical protein
MYGKNLKNTPEYDAYEKKFRKQFSNALNRFRVNLSRTINNKANQKADELSERLMNVAQKKALEYIDTYTEFKPTSGSLKQLEDLKNRIVVTKTKSKSKTGNQYKLSVKNLKSKDDFALFLEYGTGHRGSLHSGETGNKDWEYKINPEHDPNFFFEYGEDKFLANSDNYPTEPKKFVKLQNEDKYKIKRTLKDGSIIYYYRKARAKKDSNAYGQIVRGDDYAIYPQKPNYKYVRSIGLRPARYMYKTRMFVKKILDESKKLPLDKVLDIYDGEYD